MWRFGRFAFVVPFAFVSATAPAALADVVPVPAVSGPIPIEGDSYPFNMASRQLRPIDLAAFDYVEEEYFLSGLANVYDWDVLFETAKVRTPNAPYTNRILVRRPAKPQKFSGTVIVELFNATGGGIGYEAPYIWADSWENTLDRGHVWVGVTSAPAALRPLKTFDPVRYAPLAWNNPLPPEQRCVPTATTETGLVWDILSQLAALLKSGDPANPLRQYEVERVYATSQTGGGILPLYINLFGPTAETAGGEPVYDGYVIKASGSPGRINQCAEAPPATHPIAKSQSPQPVIRLFSHSDVLRGSPTHTGSICDFRRPDSDDVAPYRHYEVAGLLVSARNQVLGAPGPEDGLRAGGIPIPPVVVPRHELPFRYLLAGAFENLDRWVSDGIAPPHAAFLEADSECIDAVVDEFGTPRGGVRTPYVDVPLATYPPLELPAIPFDAEQLEELYGNHGNYLRQVLPVINDLIDERWVTLEDGRKIIGEAVDAKDLFE